MRCAVCSAMGWIRARRRSEYLTDRSCNAGWAGVPCVRLRGSRGVMVAQGQSPSRGFGGVVVFTAVLRSN